METTMGWNKQSRNGVCVWKGGGVARGRKGKEEGKGLFNRKTVRVGSDAMDSRPRHVARS
jgi:hypothetical protein